MRLMSFRSESIVGGVFQIRRELLVTSSHVVADFYEWQLLGLPLMRSNVYVALIVIYEYE